VSRATKKIGLAHLKTMGLGFDFFLVPVESYFCV
jgi:hypothetical protein